MEATKQLRYSGPEAATKALTMVGKDTLDPMVPPTAVTDAKSADSAVAVKDPVKDTILTPRFYTTDFEAMAAMDLRPNEA